MAIAVTAILLAFLISYCITPFVRQVARRYGFVDRPDGHRKMQATPVSLGGGLSLLISTTLVVGIMALWWGEDILIMTPKPLSLLGLGIAALLLAGVGVIDDGFGIRGSQKLLWQVVAVSTVMGTGLHEPAMSFMGWKLSLGFLGSLFTIVWLLAAINSFNLIDGVDGLAGSVGVVFSLTFGVIALFYNRHLDALIAFSLAGALLGFLRFNFPPASIYMGDTGSMFIGLVLGTIALRCSLKQAATLAFAAPLAIWSIPIFDSMAAVIRRKLTGRSIYATDRGHIHHVLLTHGFSARQAVGLITGLCAVTSLGAISSLYFEREWIGIVTVLAVITLLVATRIFGHVEFLLLNSRVLGFGRFLSPFSEHDKSSGKQTALTLQGSRKWEALWSALVETAEEYQLIRVQLNLALPQLHEDFFATWQRSGKCRQEMVWQTEVPLVVDGNPIGRLQVAGLQEGDHAAPQLNQVIEWMEAVETKIGGLVREDLARLPQAGQSALQPDEPETEAPLVQKLGSGSRPLC